MRRLENLCVFRKKLLKVWKNPEKFHLFPPEDTNKRELRYDISVDFVNFLLAY